MDTPRSFSRVAVTNDSHATGPSLPQGARLVSESSASREADRETYAVLIKSQGAGGEKKLVALDASNPSAKTPITGTWAFDLADTDIAPFALGQTLPPFTLNSTGSFQADRRFQEIQLTGKSDLIVDKLDTLAAGLSALGRVQVLADFDGVHRAAGIRINRLSVDVSGEKPVVSIKALQALEVVPATGEIKVAAPADELVRLTLAGLPLAWASPFLPEGLTLSGDDVRGEWTARAHNGGFTVRSAAPLLLGNLLVTQAGQPLLSNVDVSLTASGDYSPAGWQADVSELAVRSRGAELLILSLRAGQSAGAVAQPVKATGRLRADLGAVMAQPATAGLTTLKAGQADLEFTASVADALRQISSKLVIRNLRPQDGQTLPGLAADLRADQHRDGKIEINLPLVFDLSGRKSDLELTGTFKPAGARWAVDAQALSRELYVDDLKTFTALQPTSQTAAKKPAGPANLPPPSSPPSPTAPTPDARPVWDAITGQLKVAFKKVVYAAAHPPVEITTSVNIMPELLTLESFNAVFPDGAAAKAEGTVQFVPATPEPYTVKASLRATEFDPQPFLSAANPGQPPTVEGKFDLTAKVDARTPSLDRIAETANVEAQLVSRGGRFHGFATSALAANLGRKQETISKLTSVGSLIGGAFGKTELAGYADKFRAGSDSIRRLVNFNFDQLNIDISQRADGSPLQIKNFSLISPDLRLLGGGTIDSASGWKSLLSSAMNLDLQMAVRGAQGDDLRTLRLLKKEADELGYTQLLERVSVKGTPSQPDAWSLIQQISGSLL
jgi:hypothetical protein